MKPEELSRYERRQLFERSKRALALEPERYATRPQLAKVYGVEVITVRMWEARSTDFPKALRTGVSGKHHSVYYDKAEVQAWLDSRAGGRPHGTRVVKAVR
jgi:predicted DNA-binding transcriptional regulator AlpA